MNNLSLFTGSGIGDWAAKQAGIETVAQCENDPCCLFCLEKLWPHTRKFSDVRHVSVESLRGLGTIDIISGGFPCQDLSTAGRGAGIEGSRSGLWREMFRVIRQVRPAWCVIENVPAIRLRGVDRVIAPLERIGYTCWPLVVGAEHVGAPHKRHRVWVVAHTEGQVQRPDAGGSRDGETAGEGTARSGVVRCGLRGANDGRLADSGDKKMLDAARCGRERAIEQRGPCGSERETHTTTEAYGFNARRWPSRPGEPQHDWEYPRLVAFANERTRNGLGDQRNESNQCGDGDAGAEAELHGVIKCSVGDATDGVAGRLRSRTNKSLLRMAGNGWVPQIPELIYRWIIEQEVRDEP